MIRPPHWTKLERPSSQSDKNCSYCGGDGRDPDIDGGLVAAGVVVRGCPKCRGTGRERVPLKWQHPLFFYDPADWRKTPQECPVSRGCVIRVDKGVKVTFHCRNDDRPIGEPRPVTLSIHEPNYLRTPEYFVESRLPTSWDPDNGERGQAKFESNARLGPHRLGGDPIDPCTPLGELPSEEA